MHCQRLPQTKLMIHIRPYRSSDADAVSQIIRTTMRISNSADYPLDMYKQLG
jgi:hypothetical protein